MVLLKLQPKNTTKPTLTNKEMKKNKITHIVIQSITLTTCVFFRENAPILCISLIIFGISNYLEGKQSMIN